MVKKVNTAEMRAVEGGAFPCGTVKGTCLTCGKMFYSKWVFGYTAYSKALKAVQTAGEKHVKASKTAFGCYGWRVKML